MIEIDKSKQIEIYRDRISGMPFLEISKKNEISNREVRKIFGRIKAHFDKYGNFDKLNNLHERKYKTIVISNSTYKRFISKMPWKETRDSFLIKLLKNYNVK